MTSTRVATALKFLRAFDTIDISTLLSVRSPTCTHIFAPSSLSSLLPMNNDAYAAHITRMQPLIERFPVTVKEIMEDEKLNRVVVWATSEAKFREEVMDGNDEEDWVYKGEYVFIFSMDESGKIERVVEFLDSKVAEKVMRLTGRAKENLERRENEV